MRTSTFAGWVVVGLSAWTLSGCYTVLNAPLTGPELQVPKARVDGSRQTQPAPELGSIEEAVQADEWYGYPRYGGYGGGYSGPYYGLGWESPYYSGYSPYYGYGYGYPYGYGYGPYSYGYDPYYHGPVGGYYVPAGYAVVSARELDELRSYSQTVSAAKETDPAAAAREQAVQETLIRNQQQTWERRTDPQDRPAPETTPKPAAQAPPPPPPSKPAAATPAEKGSAQPKKTRR